LLGGEEKTPEIIGEGKISTKMGKDDVEKRNGVEKGKIV